MSSRRQDVRIHATADVSEAAVVGEGTSIWHEVQIREGAHLGTNCIVGKGAYIDANVQIGDNCKIQNRASVYHGTTLGDGVFVGPHVVFTNDKRPRAINPDGTRKSGDDWKVGTIHVRDGASIGANSVIVTDVTIGRFAMVGSGAVVTRNVPDYGLVLGNPARLVGYVCACGSRLDDHDRCPSCARRYVRTAFGIQEASEIHE